jgi:hypothetical protein
MNINKKVNILSFLIFVVRYLVVLKGSLPLNASNTIPLTFNCSVSKNGNNAAEMFTRFSFSKKFNKK